MELDILYRSNEPSPLGLIADVAMVRNSVGIPSYRVLGSYALIFLIGGQGTYADAMHKPTAVSAGDMLLLFPDVTHRYGPVRGSQWDEFYLLFHGPAFDLWRSSGIITPERPLFRLGATETWLKRLRAIIDVPVADPLLRQTVMIARLQAVLAEVLASQSVPLESSAQVWLTEARNRLESELSVAMDYRWLAGVVGLSYDRFRKKFVREMGVTPQQYRTNQRLGAAQKMLTETELSVREIAASVGYYDEFAFSNRFKHVIGVSPRGFRQRPAGLEDGR